MRAITNKMVQVHFECVCGRNVVDHESYQIRWKDFSKAGIRRKVSKSDGKPFLLQIEKSTECHCYEQY